MSEIPNKGVKGINISQEMKTSFLDYAMSVIVSRALPDVRDGLKPVHRRILYGMQELGNTPDKPHKKSARIVGDVMGKYHPHGDSSIYEAMVRMAQDFSYRYMLVDGHGNFGSVDGDGAAAMRYTESRMSKIALELLRDINKNTIDYKDNYDGQEKEPVVLPSRYPNLLVNGASGIAVGMATNIPSHNLGEIIDGVLALSENPAITIEELMSIIPGPDFPTGGIILGRSGIRRAYETGRGSVLIRAKVEIEQKASGKEVIIVTELPYQVNKARLIEKIAELVRDKKIDGITHLADESDRNGMRIVIEVRKDANSNVLLNNLYKQTALQSSFGVNMLALVDNQPKVLNIKEMLYYYLEHQKVVIRRRTQFELNKAEDRAHILEGLRIALDHIDEIIALIRASQTGEEAKNGLMEKFNLSERQAQAILDMRLQRLTGLERDKIEEEYNSLVKLIEELKFILANEYRVLEIIREEITEIKDRYADKRRTEIVAGGAEVLEDEDLIPVENSVLTLTNKGYIKRLPANTYKSQKRGGRGVQGMGTNEDDFVEHLLYTSTHDTILFFTNKGKVYRARGFEVPEYGRTAKGLPIVNLLGIERDEQVTAMIRMASFEEDNYFIFTTKHGVTKRSPVSGFAHIRANGLIAISLRDEDELIAVRLTDGNKQIIIGTRQGKLVRFEETDIRSMGRTASGVRGVRLKDDDYVVGMEIIEPGQEILVVTENGYGKRTPESEYRLQSRGGMGVKTCQITEKNGPLCAVKAVDGTEDLMLITINGMLIRMDVNDISVTGRSTQGVRLMRLAGDELIATVAKVKKEDDEEIGEEDSINEVETEDSINEVEESSIEENE
ncbi:MULTISPECIES: DNA gyrase subunit A [Bacillaceae]|uniref:DNA gyrase subunit A n=1 Tax=Bacillaceae TaxID=186817 RepID=UPI0006AE1251|nr:MULTISPECIES: DNA gyrase subunit A [Bacillaceae]ALC87136.1 DNA gyrase subunit A [Bacillus sp. FJAT-22090]KQL12410.1 DNA gyrase subunit A [Psychrobacillus sp. FJAT-21963]MDF2067519.1 DNA gyrase subunit A [Bacillus sp. Cr_A10]